MKNIRNFCIIAHIDHGKSTLADRLLETTGTIESRRMRPQYLDQLELERERGITIKMAPVRMLWYPHREAARIATPNSANNFRGDSRPNDSHVFASDSGYILNLIDTPGHSDFSYEVSRALNAVEGAVLLVDATKGIQAQTLSNFRAAKRAGLAIIGAVNKVDLFEGQGSASPVDRAASALAELLGVEPQEILRVSGKSGAGVPELIKAIVERVPPPRERDLPAGFGGRALIFDSLYNDHKGILAFIRVFDGAISAGDDIELIAGDARCRVKEVGYFAPELKAATTLAAGEIGYLATGLKEPARIKIGDTVLDTNVHKYATNSTNGNPIRAIRGSSVRIRESLALPGYREPSPVVFISFYPDGTTKFEDLKRGLERLRLTDAALSFEPDANEALGRGMKVGFLGQLHVEIVASRLEREFNVQFLTSFPSIAYRVRTGGVERIVKDAHEFPSDADAVFQPMIKVEMLAPSAYLGALVNLKQTFNLDIIEIQNIAENVVVIARMPLAELIRDFDDQMKSVSAGYASFSYELDGEASAEVEKLEILVAGDVASALTRIVFKKDLEREARSTVERLKELLPREQFVQAIQARAQGRIIARETIPAMKKELGNFGKNGGDRTRKMKLWKKQQRGKERLQERARVHLPVEVFREILKK
jgi:GTP-binding protein LepA